MIREEASNSGQALLELLCGLPLLLTVGIGGALLLRTEWDRLRCAYRVFESTRSVLEGGRELSGVTVHTGDDVVEGRARCGGAAETVVLPRLEAAQWD